MFANSSDMFEFDSDFYDCSGYLIESKETFFSDVWKKLTQIFAHS